MNYRYERSAVVNAHDVVELKTGHTIGEGLSLAKAKELTRSLNFGSGFAGWTPNFFLHKMHIAENNF